MHHEAVRRHVIAGRPPKDQAILFGGKRIQNAGGFRSRKWNQCTIVNQGRCTSTPEEERCDFN